MTSDPRPVYSQLLDQRRAEIALRERRHQWLAYARLAAVAAALTVVWFALAWKAFSILWVLAPGAVFVALIVIHERLLKAMERRRRAQRYFEKGMARLDGKWIGTGEPGDRYLVPEHPYAQDLDLFGKGSVFELLCTARTRIGEDTLAHWLMNPASPDTVRARQEAVSELRPRLDLREDLAVLAEEARTGVEPVALAAWGEAPPILQQSGLRAQVWTFTVLGLIGFALLWTMFLYEAGVVRISEAAALLVRDGLLISLVVNGAFLYRKRHALGAATAAVEEASHELGLLSEVLCRVEKEQFRSPLLAQLRAGLDSEGEPPSRRLARLKRLMEYLDSRDNVLVRILEVFILWTPHMALKVEDWRRHSGAAVRRWLNAAGELEALCSLASHALASCRPVSGIQRSRALPRGRSHRPSAVGRRPRGAQRCADRGRPAAAGGERLQHVGQEHLAADARRQRGSGPGRRAGSRPAASPFAAGIGGIHPDFGLAAGGRLALLRRDSAAAPNSGPDRGKAAGVVSDRRIPALDQLARPAHRRRGPGARPGGARCYRSDYLS